MSWQNRIIGSGVADPKTFTPHQKNWRNHPKKQSLALEGVLEEIGWIQDIIVNKRTGKLIDGHLRVELAIKNKESEVPVKYVDLSKEEEETALITLDPISAMAEADSDLLNALIENCKTENEKIQELLQDIAKREKLPVFNKEVNEDDYVPPPEIETDIQRGDIYELGKHRVMCGDSTSREDVEQLMQGKKADLCFTSPPYNAGSLNIKGQPVTNKKYINISDEMGEDEYHEFIDSTISNIINFIDELFINIGLVEKNKRAVLKILNKYRMWFKDIIYWEKSSSAPHIQEGIINNRIEPIYCFSLDGKRKFKNYQFKQGSYWNVIKGNNASNNEYSNIHKATFPVYLPSNIIDNFSPKKGLILDPFLGSGTTLIACEQLDRTCYGMEISPQYCEIICQRWEKFTGQKRQKVTPP